MRHRWSGGKVRLYERRRGGCAVERLAAQLAFIAEIDKLKHVLRQNLLLDGSRRENTAEHTWELAMMALVLVEYAGEPVDLLRVLKMLLIHDLVEIDAGDTFAYDDQGHLDKEERERQAAARIFGLLPAEQAQEIAALWDEFEANETAEARFALALDRLQPMIHNYRTEGAAWKKNGVSGAKALARAESITRGSKVLGEFARKTLLDAMAKGYLAE